MFIRTFGESLMMFISGCGRILVHDWMQGVRVFDLHTDVHVIMLFVCVSDASGLYVVH